MLIDYRYKSVIGYIVYFMLSILTAMIAIQYKCVYSLLFGNIITYLTSFYCISSITDVWWIGFFKPVLPTTLALLIVIVSLFMQIVTVMITKSFMKPNVTS